MECAQVATYRTPGIKVTWFNGTLWISDFIRSDGGTAINKTISVSNQTLILVTSYVSNLLVMRDLLWYACFQLYHLRSSHNLKRNLVRPCMRNISGLSASCWESQRLDLVFWWSATTKAISLPSPQIDISYGPEIEYSMICRTIVF